MSLPQVNQTITGYVFVWQEEKIEISVSNLSYKSNNLKGEIKVKTFLPDYYEHLHQANFNFSSTRSKDELVRTLAKMCDKIDWKILVEQLRVKTLEYYRQGEPLEIISSEDEIKDIHYIIEPLLPEGLMTIIYGKGGAGKSYLALFLSLLVDTHTNGYFQLDDQKHNILYLDWETDTKIITYQYKKLCRGLGKKSYLFYKRCSLPLCQDADSIKEKIVDINADIVIIDSLGVACGADPNEAQTANQLALILRGFKTTNFLIHHTSKERTNNKTPFGSVYFTNNARNLWEIKKVQGQDTNEVNLGLFHRKANYSRLYAPIGLRFLHEKEKILVEKQDITEIPDLEKELPLRQKIKNLLLGEGVLTAQEIALRLEVSQNQVSVRLQNMKKRGEIVRQHDKWAVIYSGNFQDYTPDYTP